MAKTLVLNGTDFSTNKIETVTIGESVPCTGISISEQTADVEYGDYYTVPVTVTPANTTDPIIWNSNNENFTVVEGIVHVNGVGEAIITATCGTHSANIVLTATATFDYDYFDTADSMYLDFSGDTASLAESNGRLAVGKVSATGYHALWTNQATKEVGMTFCPIPIPAGAESMTINYTNTHSTRIGFADMNTECSSGYGGVKIVSFEATVGTATSRTISVPSGANGFYASVFSDVTTDKELVSFVFE